MTLASSSSERKRPSRRRRVARIALMVVLSAVTLVVLGKISNSMTADACEKDSSAWLSGLFLQNGWTGYRETGRAVQDWPWIISVEYHYSFGNLGMEQGKWTYLCLFGTPIKVGKTVIVQS